MHMHVCGKHSESRGSSGGSSKQAILGVELVKVPHIMVVWQVTVTVSGYNSSRSFKVQSSFHFHPSLLDPCLFVLLQMKLIWLFVQLDGATITAHSELLGLVSLSDECALRTDCCGFRTPPGVLY